VKNLKEACRSRERAAALGTGETLGRRRRGQLAAMSRKRERGRALGFSVRLPGRARGLKEEKAQGGIRRRVWLNPRTACGIPGGVPNPEGEAWHRGAGANLKRVAALERAYGTIGGSKAPKG